jgi:protein-disulfide isomerase
VAAIALAVAVGGEASVAKALAEGGRQRAVAEQSAWSLNGAEAVDAVIQQAAVRGLTAVPASRDTRRPPMVADVAQRSALLGLPARLSRDGAGIDVGYPDAPVTLTVFEDFRCPVTRDFENAQGATLADLATRHAVLVRYVIESSLDQRLPGPGALFATNAARAALAHARFPLYHALLFANQPPESEAGFTENRLLEIASAVPGLRGPAFDAEVHRLWYRAWVAGAQRSYDDAHVHHGTPSLLLNGQEVDLGAQPQLLRDPAALRALVQNGTPSG